jgi:hypothetical protein
MVKIIEKKRRHAGFDPAIYRLKKKDGCAGSSPRMTS